MSEEYYTYPARLESIIDGDTVEVVVDQGFNTYRRIEVRLKGVDTAEIFGVDHDSKKYHLGMEQKEFTKEFLTTDSNEDYPLTLKTYGKGKYGRWIGDIYKDGERLSEKLINKWPDTES